MKLTVDVVVEPTLFDRTTVVRVVRRGEVVVVERATIVVVDATPCDCTDLTEPSDNDNAPATFGNKRTEDSRKAVRDTIRNRIELTLIPIGYQTPRYKVCYMTAKKATKTQTSTPVKPRLRRTREEGKQLLSDAAQKLLLFTTPGDLGIREIGALAGVHHRFVAEWFGGKVGLFRAVHDARTQVISDLISTQTVLDQGDGSVLESIRGEIVLVNWLISQGSKFESVEEAFPSVIAIKKFLMITMNLNEEVADKSAQVIGAIVIADAVLYPHIKSDYKSIDLILHHVGAIDSKTSREKAK